ncbi:MAG: hypothetical protein MUC96_17090 [Myxococcaceae bacterium]|jgi:hypothetical protein|nr:hypothetical protein [Myxococcaceae bacterium]
MGVLVAFEGAHLRFADGARREVLAVTKHGVSRHLGGSRLPAVPGVPGLPGLAPRVSAFFEQLDAGKRASKRRSPH